MLILTDFTWLCLNRLQREKLIFRSKVLILCGLELELRISIFLSLLSINPQSIFFTDRLITWSGVGPKLCLMSDGWTSRKQEPVNSLSPERVIDYQIWCRILTNVRISWLKTIPTSSWLTVHIFVFPMHQHQIVNFLRWRRYHNISKKHYFVILLLISW